MASGIPYFTLPPIDLGPIDLQPFGILVAIGVLLGSHLIHRRGARMGQNDDALRGLVGWTAVAGFVGAHVFDVLAYQADELSRDPLLLLKIWDGISSYGGFIGGTVAFLIYVRRHRLPTASYADTIMWGLAPGFTLGRLGCTIVHDHIGAYTEDFFLATNYTREVILAHGYGSPAGTLQPGLHHNLGFYEFLFMLVLCGLMVLLDRKPRAPGFLVAVVITFYAPVRFLMEFLRVNPAADPRYAGLTFAQWASIVTTLIGVSMLVRLGRAPAPAPAGTGGASPSKDETSTSGQAQTDRMTSKNSKPGRHSKRSKKK